MISTLLEVDSLSKDAGLQHPFLQQYQTAGSLKKNALVRVS
jgi:hypothetical protein